MLASSPRVRIETPSLQGSINLKGARIDDLVLLRERQTIDKNSPPVRLLSPAGAPGANFASFGWTGDGIAAPGPDTVWTASAPVLTPGRPVTLSWTSPSGQRFEQTIAVDDDYLFTVKQRVANAGANAIVVRPYGLISRATKSADLVAGPTTSVRSACSTAPPITTSAGKILTARSRLLRQDFRYFGQAGSTRFHPTAVGSASPTNIG